MQEDIQLRINQIQSALAGADNQVYEWAAKFIHTASKINLFSLPCCQPIVHINPTKSIDKAAEAPLTPALKSPLWIPVLEMGQVKKKYVHPISKHIAKGAHIQYKKEALTTKATILLEGIAQNFYLNDLTVLSEGGHIIAINYEQVVAINAHSAGKPKEGFFISYPDKYKLAQS